jgi:hypothetical protein
MKSGALREWLPAQLSASPTLTLAERCEAFEEQRGSPLGLTAKLPAGSLARAHRLGKLLLVYVIHELVIEPNFCAELPLKWRISVQGPRCL